MNLEHYEPTSEDSAERVGAGFIEAQLREAQRKAWLAIEEVAAAITPGCTEGQALLLLKESLKHLNFHKMWHPPQIRFGVNTLKPFGKPSEPDVVLSENDIFFLDIGPLFDGYEGDAGKSFVVGKDPEMARLVADSKTVFDLVRQHWQMENISGEELYRFAEGVAEARGWTLSLHGASGHRVSEFPHALHHKGKLKQMKKKPAANRWILEIHLISDSLGRGAFFEDIL